MTTDSTLSKPTIAERMKRVQEFAAHDPENVADEAATNLDFAELLGLTHFDISNQEIDARVPFWSETYGHEKARYISYLVKRLRLQLSPKSGITTARSVCVLLADMTLETLPDNGSALLFIVEPLIKHLAEAEAKRSEGAFKIGDVVHVRSHHLRMVIDAYYPNEETPYLLVAYLNNKYRSFRLPAIVLNRVNDPSCYPRRGERIAPGDTVKLRSGGPTMTVINTSHPKEDLTLHQCLIFENDTFSTRDVFNHLLRMAE